MGDVPTHLSPPPPPPPLPLKSNIPILYYGLVVVGAAAIILFIYNLVVVRWCSTQHHRPSENGPSGRSTGSLEPGSSRSFGSRNINLAAASFRYKKGDKDDQNSEYDECPVCLSVFEEGEEVRQLPRCRHCFHAPCIDMWLHSHFDCPVCRTPVEPPPVLRRHTAVDPPENSRRVLLDTGSLV